METPIATALTGSHLTVDVLGDADALVRRLSAIRLGAVQFRFGCRADEHLGRVQAGHRLVLVDLSSERALGAATALRAHMANRNDAHLTLIGLVRRRPLTIAAAPRFLDILPLEDPWLEPRLRSYLAAPAAARQLSAAFSLLEQVAPQLPATVVEELLGTPVEHLSVKVWSAKRMRNRTSVYRACVRHGCTPHALLEVFRTIQFLSRAHSVNDGDGVEVPIDRATRRVLFRTLSVGTTDLRSVMSASPEAWKPLLAARLRQYLATRAPGARRTRQSPGAS